MPPRTESDEKYVLDLVAEVLAEPGYRWQHRFPTLLGDPGQDGKRRPLPVDGYFPRHRLIVEYWEKQHSASVPIMDEGTTISGMSRGRQRRLYDQRRQAWARANDLGFLILDYRGFETDEQGRLKRNPERDRQIVAEVLHSAGLVREPSRKPFDHVAYSQKVAEGCFICRLVQGDSALPPHHVIWRSDHTIAFLDRFPTVYGYSLVAPASHREKVSGDFTLYEYLNLQRIVHAIAEAVRLALRPERVYILSLGSHQANAHVHWHIVPCPPGTPFDQQQIALVDKEQQGILHLTEEEGADLVSRLRVHLPSWMKSQ
jgi:ATP adenylyltransferase